MKAQVNDKIRIVNKMNDWSMEYKEGDIFTVESTWYGGVNVTSKTGVPISLDEVEYEIISEEQKYKKADEGERKVIFHVDSETGFLSALKGAEALQHHNQVGSYFKIEVLTEGEAVLKCRSGEAVSGLLKKLQGYGVRIVVCEDALEEFYVSKEELGENIGVVQAGVVELIKRQMEGYAYIRY